MTPRPIHEKRSLFEILLDVSSVICSSSPEGIYQDSLMRKTNLEKSKLDLVLKESENNGLIFYENHGISKFYKMQSKGQDVYEGLIKFISYYDLQSVLRCRVEHVFPTVEEISYEGRPELKRLSDIIFAPYPNGVFGLQSPKSRRSYFELYMDVVVLTSPMSSRTTPIMGLANLGYPKLLKILEKAIEKDHVRKLDYGKGYARTQFGSECVMDWTYLYWKFLGNFVTTNSIPKLETLLETLKKLTGNIETLERILF